MTLKDIVIKIGQNVLTNIDNIDKPTTLKSIGDQICRSTVNLALDKIPETIQTQNIKRQIRKELHIKKEVVYFEDNRYNDFK